MRSALSLLAAVALLSTTAYATLLSRFDTLLSGNAPLTAESLDELYTTYKSVYPTSLAAKHYGNEDSRRQLFEDKVREIVAHNTDGKVTYKKGLNEYSDMTEGEFFDYFNIRAEQNCSATIRPPATVNIEERLRGVAASWNWKDFGVVTPVKNQAKCGSCWTFSTVGAMEAHYMMRYGSFRNLSEQQLVDCADAFDNHGCNGGLPSHAFEYIMYAGGLSEEADYPYVAVTNNCSFQSINPVVGVIGGSVNISTSEVDMQAQLFENGPVSVAFEVIGGFRDYKTGVYANNTCKNGPDDVNHAVLAVGYGTEDGTDYWLVKNSWGAAWGDNGYFKIQRGVNMCGIAQCNSYPNKVVDLTFGGASLLMEETATE